YRMNRSIFKVPDLWREWRSGLGGETPVEVLEHRYGRRWCPNAAERKFFLRRKVLVDAIVKRAK
ncbi:transcriptional activator of glycolytic enzymes-domain-containing protein, partial [Phlyctochytrium arcticum]